MKTLEAALFGIIFLIVFVTCKSATGQLSDLSNKDSRNEIMTKIANDSRMSKEMIGAMMNSNKGRLMMQENQIMTLGNHSSMMNILQNNPGIMQSMFSSMIQRAKGDTTLMSEMIKTRMDNQQMMTMMQSRFGNGGINGMNHAGAMAN